MPESQLITWLSVSVIKICLLFARQMLYAIGNLEYNPVVCQLLGE